MFREQAEKREEVEELQVLLDWIVSSRPIVIEESLFSMSTGIAWTILGVLSGIMDGAMDRFRASDSVYGICIDTLLFS
jgi:hypothetical protein